MQIVTQSAPLAHSLFPPPRLALPAPKIAGLLPAPKPTPPPKPFIYAEPCLAALPDAIRAQFDKLLRTLLDTTVGLLADERNEAEFDLANKTFVRLVTALYHDTVIGDPKPTISSPFSNRRQQLNDKIDRMVAESKGHLAEATERIVRELAALHAQENVR